MPKKRPPFPQAGQSVRLARLIQQARAFLTGQRAPDLAFQVVRRNFRQFASSLKTSSQANTLIQQFLESTRTGEKALESRQALQLLEELWQEHQLYRIRFQPRRQWEGGKP